MKKIRIFACGLAIALLCLPLSCKKDEPVAAQTWNLINQMGDVATVTVLPFTNSGTFMEDDDSPGWFIYFGGCNVRLTIWGHIVHAGDYDRWSFTVSQAGCSHFIQGQAEGTSNGNFPDATQINNGTFETTMQGPMGSSQHTQGFWTAVKVK